MANYIKKDFLAGLALGRTMAGWDAIDENSFKNLTIKQYIEHSPSNIKYEASCSLIGSYAFFRHEEIIEANFPKCTSVYYEAFKCCYNLQSINLPECVYIGDNVFAECSSLTSVSFSKCTSVYGFAQCVNLQEVSFPECIYIGFNAFRYDIKLKSVSFPKCSYIGANAFAKSGLITGHFPECKAIGYMAFDCDFISSIVLGPNVPEIPDYIIFYNTIPQIYIPYSAYDAYMQSRFWKAYSSYIITF